ncbi:Uncharacterised protein [Vibrio cholerae]|uniref:Uncharacterized protein n=1 Tax=Vibrio cholerae TaxID=666 RepID=A0A655YKW5_VIBCL|nr:Uncharacterised protein [Vibrio cholerae]CSA84461.1 Uncharacterised protein [Vibrio cholerae]CSA89495.1 Uncharacterised protein [Vibrio cholerae]CSB01441.1 Uncharacterised protein [Vibrio cholerae]CSB02849.1 Uncharacterised protein [Vibrio cholerae]
MSEIAIYIKTSNKQIMNALKQRIIHYPSGFGRLTHQSLHDRCAIEMAENR